MSDDKQKDVTVGLGGLAMSMTAGSATTSTSTSGGMMFTFSARQLAANARTLDHPVVGLDRSAFDQRARELMAASLGATLMAYLSIESAVNELLLAHSLGYVGNFKGLDQGVARKLSEAWAEGADRLNALEKADLITVVAGGSKIDPGSGFAQKTAVLHDLRNAFVHHKPMIVEHGRLPRDSEDNLERRLSSQFARATIWTPPGSAPFRWAGCLGAGCATWACTVADGFIRQVYRSTGVEFLVPPYTAGA